MRIFQDNVDDLWVERADSTLVCMAEGVRSDAAEDGWGERTFDDVERGYGPLVRMVPGIKAKIITLCGSTKFKEEINRANAELSMLGNLVISLGVFGHTDMPGMDWTTGGSEVKRMLDDLHKQKIDLADEIYVVNVNGYIGESTRSEIDYALASGKAVRYLEPIA